MQGPPHRSPQHLHQHPRRHQHAPLHTTPKAAQPKPAQPTNTKAYNPRHPERTLLYRTVAEHFETWLELASAGQFDGQGDHHTPPAYVEKPCRPRCHRAPLLRPVQVCSADLEPRVSAFRKYLECGIFAHGFARVRCDDCGDDFLVAFSCKGRGVCPSCNTRRMAEAAAHLTDHVFPRLPVRQWVLLKCPNACAITCSATRVHSLRRCASSCAWCSRVCRPIAPVPHSVTCPVCTWARSPSSTGLVPT